MPSFAANIFTEKELFAARRPVKLAAFPYFGAPSNSGLAGRTRKFGAKFQLPTVAQNAMRKRNFGGVAFSIHRKWPIMHFMQLALRPFDFIFLFLLVMIMKKLRPLFTDTRTPLEKKNSDTSFFDNFPFL